jgi:hypothetical protein
MRILALRGIRTSMCSISEAAGEGRSGEPKRHGEEHQL